MNFTPFKSIDYIYHHNYNIGDKSTEEELSEVFQAGDLFLDRIVTKIAEGTFGSMPLNVQPIVSLLGADIEHILDNYPAFDKKYIDTIKNSTEIEDPNFPSKLSKYVITQKFVNQPHLDSYYKLGRLCESAVVLIPYVLKKFPNVTYSQLFPNLSDHLMKDTIEVESFVNITPCGGFLSTFFAPSEAVYERYLPEQANKLALLRSDFHALLEKFGFEKVWSEPASELCGESACYGLDIASTGKPLNLNIADRKVGNSEDNIRKKSLKVIPERLEIREDLVPCQEHASSKGINEYRNKASGKFFQFNDLRIWFVVRFRLQHEVKATKQVLINRLKTYKKFDTYAISNMLNTIKTMIEMPGHMEVDSITEDPLNPCNTTLILKNLDFTGVCSADNDQAIKQRISEYLSKSQKKFGSVQLFDFIRTMNGLDSANSEGIGAGSAFFNKGHGGFHSVIFDYYKNVPNSLNEILTNLQEAQELFSNLAKECAIAQNYLGTKIKELNIDSNSKMSYRELVIRILINEIRLDPLSLLAKNSDYIQNIAKEFI